MREQTGGQTDDRQVRARRLESVNYPLARVSLREHSPGEMFQEGQRVPRWHSVNTMLKNGKQSAPACFRDRIPLLCGQLIRKRADETRTGDRRRQRYR